MSMHEARVSVVIPAHNAERYLAEAIGSVLGQTVGRMDIVVVDDGSADATCAVAAEFAGRGGVVCVPMPERRGTAAARNRGIAAASGEYLAFLDADDLWLPERTAVLGSALLRARGPAIALGHVEQFLCPTLTPEKRASLRPPPPPGPAYLAGGILMRRADFAAVGPFDEGLTLGEFIDWFGRARRAGLAEIVVPDIVLRRRVHGDNTSLRQRAAAADYLEVVRRELARKRTDGAMKP
jgi:glycosyltransferase involved in cell wall biosynthesis